MAGFISLRWMAHTLGQGLLEHTPHDATRIEVFLGQRAHQIVHVPEPEEAVGIGQKAAGTRVLYHGRLPAGQIAGSAVADPTGRQFDVGWLGATELASRSLDVGAVLLRRRADIPGFTNLPAQGFQTGAPFLVVAS